jgi:glycosyltransferase involved in cell wall biosynthesis
MACGTPVLTTDDVATAGLSQGAVATVGPGVEALAAGIRRVLQPDEAARLRAAGSALVGRFSWSAAAAAHVGAYRAALGSEPVGDRESGR